jgi:hypothetical protein
MESSLLHHGYVTCLCSIAKHIRLFDPLPMDVKREAVDKSDIGEAQLQAYSWWRKLLTTVSLSTW